MPPHQQTPRDDTEAYEAQIKIESRKEELRQFSQYCQFFYRDSLSLKQAITCSQDDLSNDLEDDFRLQNERESRETCKAVMQAFETICASRKALSGVDETHRHAIARCGLLDSEFLMGEQGKARMSSYTKAKDIERHNAHENLMIERKNHFFELLEEQQNQTIDLDANPSPKHGFLLNLQQWEIDGKKKKLVRQFSGTYKSKIGVHPWLAGLKKLFETQLQNADIVIKWDFDIGTLTENCSGDDVLLRDALSLITAILVRDDARRNGEEKKEEDVGTPSISWKISDDVSISLMKSIANILPHSKELHARPTGKIILSNEVRKYEPESFLDSWCVVQ